MNIRKTLLTTTLFFAGTATALLADNGKAIEFYKTGRIEPAKAMLLQNLATGAGDKAEAPYYLGEIYKDANQLDSAAYYYGVGKAADPANLMNSIGELSLLKLKNPTAADQQFEALLSNKLNRKNPDLPSLYVAAAAAYKDRPIKAEEFLNKAKAMDKKLASIYVLEADMQAANKDYNGAAANYEQAITFDPNCKEAYVKYARIYAPINSEVAAEVLNRLLAHDPSSAVAHRELAEIYYKDGKLLKAAEAYAEYINDAHVSTSDYARYATILFFKGDYAKSKEIVEQALPKTPRDLVLNRLMFYNDFELGKKEAARSEADKFFNAGYEAADFIGQDYLYYGRLLIQDKQFQQGIAQLQKALELDPGKIELYQEIGSAYEGMNDYDNAIANFSLYIQKAPEDQVQVADYFNLGKAAYYAGSEMDTTAALYHTKRAAYFAKADSMFSFVAEKVPDSYLGHFWRARVNSALDPETDQGLAKPFYEKTIEVLDAKGDGDPRIYIECYSYLGYYYYVKEDIENSKIYWEKILAIDPTNEIANRAMSGLK